MCLLLFDFTKSIVIELILAHFELVQGRFILIIKSSPAEHGVHFRFAGQVVGTQVGSIAGSV